MIEFFVGHPVPGADGMYHIPVVIDAFYYVAGAVYVYISLLVTLLPWDDDENN